MPATDEERTSSEQYCAHSPVTVAVEVPLPSSSLSYVPDAMFRRPLTVIVQEYVTPILGRVCVNDRRVMSGCELLIY